MSHNSGQEDQLRLRWATNYRGKRNLSKRRTFKKIRDSKNKINSMYFKTTYYINSKGGKYGQGN